MYVTLSPLGDGFSAVELVSYMGDDLTVVNAARVSYAKRSDLFTEKGQRLIEYLMRNKHGTPFEHVIYTFRVRAPLFVVHQWERHRVASYNEESGRYIELRGDFYVPDDAPNAAIGEYAAAAQEEFARYRRLLELGEPKERARMVLTAQLYKEFWFTVNARSLMNFLELSNDEHAQWEIRQYAIAIEKLFTDVTPAIAAAFAANGRVAP